MDVFRAAIPLSEAAALLSEAIDRSGLQHVELDGQRQDYRYVILTLDGHWGVWNPHPQDPNRLLEAHGFTTEYFVKPAELRKYIATYLDALRKWQTS